MTKKKEDGNDKGRAGIIETSTCHPQLAWGSKMEKG